MLKTKNPSSFFSSSSHQEEEQETTYNFFETLLFVFVLLGKKVFSCVKEVLELWKILFDEEQIIIKRYCFVIWYQHRESCFYLAFEYEVMKFSWALVGDLNILPNSNKVPHYPSIEVLCLSRNFRMTYYSAFLHPRCSVMRENEGIKKMSLILVTLYLMRFVCTYIEF